MSTLIDEVNKQTALLPFLLQEYYRKWGDLWAREGFRDVTDLTMRKVRNPSLSHINRKIKHWRNLFLQVLTYHSVSICVCHQPSGSTPGKRQGFFSKLSWNIKVVKKQCKILLLCSIFFQIADFCYFLYFPNPHWRMMYVLLVNCLPLVNWWDDLQISVQSYILFLQRANSTLLWRSWIEGKVLYSHNWF